MRIAVALLSLLTAVYAYGATLDERPVVVPEYTAVPNIDRYATEAEYEAARRDARFKLTRVSYESDGLTVFAYLYAPAEKPDRPCRSSCSTAGATSGKSSLASI